MATFSIAALRDEFVTDPVNLGYAPFVAGGDQNGLYEIINRKRSSGEYQQDRDPVTPDVLFGVLDPLEFAAVNATGVSRLQTILTLPVIDLASNNVRTIVDGIFPLAGPTRQAIAALQKRDGSRAEVLFGRGFIVTLNQIGQALAL